MKKMSFVLACIDFFGLTPGQTKLQFMSEIKKLTDEDRIDLTRLLEKSGYEIVAQANPLGQIVAKSQAQPLDIGGNHV